MNSFFVTSEAITAITLFLWISCLIAGFGKILFWTHIVASKNYQIRHFLDFLNTRAGMMLVAHPVGLSDIFLALFLCILLQYYGVESIVWLQFSLVSIILYTAHSIWYCTTHLYFSSERPSWNLKSTMLFFGSILLSVITTVFISLFKTIPDVVALSLFQLLIPLYGWLILVLFSPFLAIYDRMRLEKARQKIKNIAPAVIIVSGSYGKSSTVMYLQQMLQHEFSVLTTKGEGDSTQEVTRSIIEELQPEHQIFIAELQGNRLNDIANACAIAPPIMHIITETNNPSSTGPLTTIERAILLEGINALPANGVTILNRDGNDSLSIAQESNSRVKFFSVNDVAHVYATDIFIEREAISFILHIGAEKRPVRAPLLGKHVLHSILAAATAASHLGISMSSIVGSIETRLAPKRQGLFTHYGLNHALIVNNISAKSSAEFSSGIDYVSIYADKNIIAIVSAAVVNEPEQLASICSVVDFCIIIGSRKKDHPALLHSFAQYGLTEESIYITTNTGQCIQLLEQSVTPEDVILLHGSLPKKIESHVMEL